MTLVACGVDHGIDDLLNVVRRDGIFDLSPLHA